MRVRTAPPVLPLAVSALAAAPATTAGSEAACAGCNDPSPPRHVHGGTWHVGTCGISVLLVTSAEGHILVDGGAERAVPPVLDNIRAAGFDPGDVQAIAFSHEHIDHVGWLAGLQQATGAPVHARAPALAAPRRGRSDRGGPQLLELDPFPPVADVLALADDDLVQAGPLRLQAVATPGTLRAAPAGPGARAGRTTAGRSSMPTA